MARQSKQRSPDRDSPRAAHAPLATSIWITSGGMLLVVGYLVLFYWSEPLHWQPLALALLPDLLLRQWTGGSLERFGVADRLPVLAAAGLLFGIAWLLGRGVLRLLRCDRQMTRLETIVFGCGLGLQCLSLWTLAMGLAGQLHRAWLVLPPPVVLSVWSLVQLIRSRRQPPINESSTRPTAEDPTAEDPTAGSRDGAVNRESWLGRYGMWLIAPLAAMIVAGGLLPPWEFDVREYHLQVPKEWYLAGQIRFLPHNVYGNMPLGAEMHALLAMVAWPGPDAWWWGALVGKTVMASCSVLTALTLYAAGRRFFGGGRLVGAGSVGGLVGVIAAAVYLATPWTAHVSMAGLNDAVVGFYVLLAVYAALLPRHVATGKSSREGNVPSDTAGASVDSGAPENSRGDSHGHYAVLSGLLAGAAISCKYPVLLFVAMPLTLWWFLARPTGSARRGAVFVLAVSLACGLWFGKNWILAGNPTYPLLNSVFSATTRSEDQDQRWRQAHRVPRDAQGRSYTADQAASSLRQIGWASRWLSPILVPLVLLAAAAYWHGRRKWPALAPLIGLMVFGVAAWWLTTHRIERFLVPLLPVAALVAGIGAAWNSSRLWRSFMAVALVGAVLVGTLVVSSRFFPADNRFLMALHEFRPDLPDAADPDFAFTDPVHQFLNETVPEGASVLLVGDAQPFDLEVGAIYNTCFDGSQLERLLDGAASADQRRAALRSAGISHVYVKWSEIDRYRSPGNYGFPEFVTRRLIRDELVDRQQVLKRLPLPLDPERAELFEVR